jgi:phage-related baseplate assembly protein
VREVFEYIEEERPIGATVTVTSGTELPINVSAVLTLKSGYVASVVNEAFARRLTEYLEATAYTIDYLPISVVGCILLNTDGVEDYADLRINDGTENIDLSAEQIAVIGTIRTEVRN